MSTIERAAARLVNKPKVNKVVVDGAELAEAPVSQASQVANPGVSKSAPAIVDKKSDKFHGKSCELDFGWLDENGFLVPGHNNQQQSQEFRRIKRPLLLNLQPTIKEVNAKPTNVIFVTSALPGEGKTFVSLNLALSLAAEIDRKVLLVDGDAAKGDLSRWLGIHGEPGLVDLLTQRNALAHRYAIDTNVDRLNVMPCGEHLENLDELYASDSMGVLLQSLADEDDSRVIVVDGPPLIATTEAAVLAHRMGQVVVVVEANKTPQSAVEQAVGQLEGCQLVSMLLNKASASASAGYGYGYGYSYGSAQNQ
ncbi:MAG: AAA family ATPase [Gammaproteobacteria bacterium]|nr:AAA family ATPase [Gammaproteobacteria bacterium]